MSSARNMRLHVLGEHNDMKQHTSEAFSITAIGWTPLVLMGTAMPPRDPDEDEEEEDDEEDDDADEPAVAREADED
ncbi:hypothetical protein EAS61_01770 [Bradyrhizobium zhanjiangense]|uniref:Uncharacterized protein n=2 Tax=Bradyrhizobium zhanjiangense TaxID=1325107 RepID=A0A4Q0R011_9BRAD|nr:hypothetical protein EAS61_01770 [Bradyrhizobium zhanjiangense]